MEPTNAVHPIERRRPGASGRAGARCIVLTAALAAVTATPSWAPSTARANQSISPSDDVFRRQYPDVDVLLDAFERGRAILYERTLRAVHAPTAPIDDSIFEELRSNFRQRERMPAIATVLAPSRAEAVFARAYEFRRRVYAILADSRIVDRVTAIEQATDDYLRAPALALPATPKSLESPDAHDGHDGANDVRQVYPKVSGLVWAHQWLELALCEPLIAYDSPEERRAGVAATVSRFREMLERAPSGLPSEMPTAPAIAPSLTQRHPRAAAIFDNVHALHQVVWTILRDAHADARPEVRVAVDTFLSPRHLAVSGEDWLLMSLRRGIWWQGGPAIGRMDEPERNRRVHHEHGRMPLPGMGDLPADVREPSGRSRPGERQTPDDDAHAQH